MKIQSLLFPLLLASLAAGCIGNRVRHAVVPTAEELREFELAGPEMLDFDVSQLRALHVGSGEYHLTVGDLLDIEVPIEVVGTTGDSEESKDNLKRRIEADGTIGMPQIERVSLVGKTVTQAEELLIGSYHPEPLIKRPSIVVTVSEYKTVSVSMQGAVTTPGLADLRSDRMSLLGALKEAGGISKDTGADRIRVIPPDGGEPVVIPVHSKSIPAADIALAGGETIVVEPHEDEQFSILGLVRKGGNFPYPSERRYNLMEALALAGGTDSTAAPRYATIYRLRADGQVVTCTFQIDGTSYVNAANILVKPGDVVSVEHTESSWWRSWLSQTLRVGGNVSASGSTQL